MAAPRFPFEIAVRDGVCPREIMCRRCAGWTAWDGREWRHVDGSSACVQPEQVWGQVGPDGGDWREPNEIADSEQQEVQ